ncbi:A/G-specific adenine glycosylase [Fistulifera solaris]|uniref:Adenine DNA glycosylase n=1 Tax=Fistulifera solaris TaxID=1519565 RepID=A0A1Z5JL92_FISSO|nr:A/G-specific adenine glycosylase [Fistulifera solaris]|eukprot:GAX14754.1 A/G-specific adenine glycosylase [Fistulifera solaris]
MPPSSRKRTVQAVLLSSSFVKGSSASADDVLPTKAVSLSSSSIPSHKTNGTELFQAWRAHDSLQFHAFTDPSEIQRIQHQLLTWYHAHRRKLPWRGDPPPWNGSTSNFGNCGNKKQKQTSLKSFFKNPDDMTGNDDTSLPTFPVTPYGVWVSEIMLQQTRVEAVIPYWVKWMQSFSTVQALATATPEQVNAHWAGLGFYRRARMLHAGAQHVVTHYTTKDGTVQWPTTVAAWQQLPGVGRYTASAICSICFQVAVPVVDGNVCRVFSRLRGVAQHVKAPVFKDQYAWTLLQPLVEHTDEPGNINQALMELGATYCAPAGTGLEEGDPLKEFYYSTRLVEPAIVSNDLSPILVSSTMAPTTAASCPLCAEDGVEQVIQQWRECAIIPNLRVYGHQYLPMAPPQSAKRVQVWQVAALSHSAGKEKRWLLVQRPPTGLLAGQWEFPCICLWDSADTKVDKKFKTLKKAVDPEPPTIPLTKKRAAWKKLLIELSVGTVSSVQTVGVSSLEHVFSHVKHILWLQTGQVDDAMDEAASTPDGRAMQWMTAGDMQQVGITSGVKKILQALKQHVEDRST